MRALLIVAALLTAGLIAVARGNLLQMPISLTGETAEVAQWFARAGTLDAPHQNAYRSLINGLVTDGVWSTLDALYIFATSTTTPALLNLKSSSYPITANGSPVFTLDKGYTGGTTGNTTVYLDTGFNAATAGGQFSLNSGTLALWNYTDAPTTNVALGTYDGTNVNQMIMSAATPDLYGWINMSGGTVADYGVTTGHANGSTILARTGASATRAFRNGASVGSTNSGASTAIPSLTFYILNRHDAGGGGGGVSWQIPAAAIGGGWTSGNAATLALALHTRVNAYFAALPVPSATFDPLQQGAGITLTSSNMVATGNAAGWATVRSTTSKSSGKVYFELGCDLVGGGAWMGGVQNASGSLTSYAGSTVNGNGYQVDTGNTQMIWWNNGAQVMNVAGTLCASGTANRVHFAFDAGAAVIWGQNYTAGTGSGKWNATTVTPPAAPTTGGQSVPFGGPYFIAWSGIGATNSSRLYANTANIEGPVPTGYTVWDSAP